MSDASAPTGLAIPPPIPGTLIDPPQKEVVRTLRKINQKSEAAGVGYRAFLRFSYANATLLAAGTTYYAFLSLFAIVVFAFGMAALLGGQNLANTVTHALSEAFPGLIGDTGVSPSTLEQVGQTTSIIGLVTLLITGSGAMVALSKSLHLIYGVPKDARNFVLARARLLAWLLLLVPLMGLSFVPSVVISEFARPVMDALGLQGGFGTWLLFGLTGALSIMLNAVVIWLILGHLGGVKPDRKPRLVGTALGSVGIEILKYLLSFIIAWSVSKPQYGAFAAPIAMLLVLWLEALTVYIAACLTAGLADASADVPATDQTIAA